VGQKISAMADWTVMNEYLPVVRVVERKMKGVWVK